MVLSLSFSSSARERINTWVFAYISFFFSVKQYHVYSYTALGIQQQHLR